MKINDFHIRPSNKKSMNSMVNSRTMFFIMVNEYLISFTDGISQTKSTTPLKLKDLSDMKFVSEVMPYRLTKLNDDSFMYREKMDNKKLDNFRIVRLDVIFDSFRTTIVVDRYQDPLDYINSFSYDY